MLKIKELPVNVQRERMSGFWTKMSTVMNAWTLDFGEIGGLAFNEWHLQLSELTLDQLYDGYKALIDSGKDRISLPAFKALCQKSNPYKAMQADLFNELLHFASIQPADRSLEAIYLSRKIDLYQFRMASSERAEKLFANAFKQLCDFLNAGGTLQPDLTPKLTQFGESYVNQETGEVLDQLEVLLDDLSVHFKGFMHQLNADKGRTRHQWRLAIHGLSAACIEFAKQSLIAHSKGATPMVTLFKRFAHSHGMNLTGRSPVTGLNHMMGRS